MNKKILLVSVLVLAVVFYTAAVAIQEEFNAMQRSLDFWYELYLNESADCLNIQQRYDFALSAFPTFGDGARPYRSLDNGTIAFAPADTMMQFSYTLNDTGRYALTFNSTIPFYLGVGHPGGAWDIIMIRLESQDYVEFVAAPGNVTFYVYPMTYNMTAQYELGYWPAGATLSGPAAVESAKSGGD